LSALVTVALVIEIATMLLINSVLNGAPFYDNCIFEKIAVIINGM
jgi:hypothetical protein